MMPYLVILERLAPDVVQPLAYGIRGAHEPLGSHVELEAT